MDDNDELNIHRSKMLVQASELYAIFEPIITQIIALVKSQMAAIEIPLTAILLVGGFGKSDYLLERLRMALVNIDIHRDHDGWTAVARGAALKGLTQLVPECDKGITVMDRKARRHYGFEMSVPYTDTLHAELSPQRRWDGFHGRWEVKAMQWYIKRVCFKIEIIS